VSELLSVLIICTNKKGDKLVEITREVYEQFKIDIPKIDEQLSSRNSSQKLWNKLRSKYSVLLPGINYHVKESGKIAAEGKEFDYRSELEQLKEVILAYMVLKPTENCQMITFKTMERNY